MRIVYAAGPGDVIRTYRHWVKGEDDPTQLAMTYSGMFYDVCREAGDDAYVIASCGRKDELRDEHFHIVHRATPFANGPGPMFYVGQMWSDLRLIARALRFEADVAVVACGNTSWALLRILPLVGIAVVPSLHCMLWSKYRKMTPLQRLFRRIRVPFFRGSAFRILSISQDVSGQLKAMTKGRHQPIIPFTPCYRRRRLRGIAPANTRRPFRVLFAGRVARNKGVFDMVEIARRLDAQGRGDIVFDICGNGPATGELNRQIEESSLTDRFRCHGRCNWQKMRAMYAEAHVVVVPTTGEFVEGFNKVIAEAVLAGRPAVTSDVCPALAYVGDAVVQVPADDVQAYAGAILRLCDDAEFYESKRLACLDAQEQFYDLDRSWMAALRKALDEVRLSRETQAGSERAAIGLSN